MVCSVEQAIRKALSPGQGMKTPTGSDFVVESLDHDGIKVDKLTQSIFWNVLSGVPKYMASLGGTVAIGAKRGSADPGTLEKFLQSAHGNVTMRASYAAPILDAASVVGILPKEGNKKQCIQLSPNWYPRS